MDTFKSRLSRASREILFELRTVRGWLPIAWLFTLVLFFGVIITLGIGRIVTFRPGDFSPLVAGSYFRDVLVWFVALAVFIVPFWFVLEALRRALTSTIRQRSRH